MSEEKKNFPTKEELKAFKHNYNPLRDLSPVSDELVKAIEEMENKERKKRKQYYAMSLEEKAKIYINIGFDEQSVQDYLNGKMTEAELIHIHRIKTDAEYAKRYSGLMKTNEHYAYRMRALGFKP